MLNILFFHMFQLRRPNLIRFFSNLIPKYLPPDASDVKDFKTFLQTYNRILILTGAGVSTESGIPDYRSEEVGLFAQSSYKPILYSEFVKNSDARSRYWARNFVGWPKFAFLRPNNIHLYISQLQILQYKVLGLITQNVDGLHFKAGSNDVLELHGNAFWVRCLQCRHTLSRHDFQTILQNFNSDMKLTTSGKVRPDGDFELSEDDVKNFKVPSCEMCGGILKPTVVFFGENVSPNVVKKAENLVEKCDALLILGTSLSTLSSSRIVLQAVDLCKFVLCINIGETKCDKYFDLKINTNINDIIRRLELKFT